MWISLHQVKVAMKNRFLFEPTIWRGRTIPSRVLLAPINTGFARNHRPSLDLLAFHRERSGPAVGIGFVGNVAIAETTALNAQTAVLRSDWDLKRFAVIARAISKRGSLAGIQLASVPVGLAPSL